MPSKVALTPAEWREKLIAVLPPWLFTDVGESVLSAHLMGAGRVLSEIEQDAYDHIDETFIMRCSEETLRAHMEERIVPELGYIGMGLRRQVQRMWNRLNILEIEKVVNDLLTNDVCQIIELGLNEDAVNMLALDYRDDGTFSTVIENEEGDQLMDISYQQSMFTVIINPVPGQTYSYIDRDAYADSGSYSGYLALDATLDLGKTIQTALDFYKAAGVRFRIASRKPKVPKP